MAAAVAYAPEPYTRPLTPPQNLSIESKRPSRSTTPIPNKHIPYCSPGPRPDYGLPSPPATPPDRPVEVEPSSVLFPPNNKNRVFENPPVYSVSAEILVDALHQISSQPLPDAKHVFPWAHGLHAQNQMQMSFFAPQRQLPIKAPRRIRGLTLVKAGGDLSRSRLKGAIAPEEILSPMMDEEDDRPFLDVDPRVGFSVRNFHIQACKFATVSDIVVYGDGSMPREEVEEVAKAISLAQKLHRASIDESDEERFNTFVLQDSFETFEKHHPELIVSDSEGMLTGNLMDFPYQERIEMQDFTKASEIAHNVWLGPTPNQLLPDANGSEPDGVDFDILIEANDFARAPDAKSLRDVERFLLAGKDQRVVAQLEFPSSGSISPNAVHSPEVDRLLEMCSWIYRMTNASSRPSSRHSMTKRSSTAASRALSSPGAGSAKRVLIHCIDGYTETTLLAMAYYMFIHHVPLSMAVLNLHRNLKRDFFAYPCDKQLLENIQGRILRSSPLFGGGNLERPMTPPPAPAWQSRYDGSLPSRILPYLYLGNLNHAMNPSLLRELGITRILSVGEIVRWDPNYDAQAAGWTADDLLYIDKVQDNGVDPLTCEFDRCLRFIEEGRLQGGKVLVHCRVGVSRSATICIAEVMKELGVSFPRAYCFVRARRLNVIIQPHLRFAYELLKWEETQCKKRDEPVRREFEWATLAREIAEMNRPYCGR